MGSTWDLFTKGGTKLGLSVRELPLDESVMKNALQQGDSIILSVGEGDFTTKGHFIVVTGYADEGFKVNGPNSYKILKSFGPMSVFHRKSKISGLLINNKMEA